MAGWAKSTSPRHGLGRKVAIKLLPEEFTRDAKRVRRFEQEARATSSLNHPNIMTIHEVGEVGHRHFIVSEFVEGETLRQRMKTSPLEPETALEVAAQVASALEARTPPESRIVTSSLKTSCCGLMAWLKCSTSAWPS